MSPKAVSIERDGEIAVLRLCHSPANAVDLEFAREFEAAFAAAMAADPRALILTGTGDFFSAGLNLKTVPSYSASQQREMLRVINRLLGALYAYLNFRSLKRRVAFVMLSAVLPIISALLL